MNVPVYNINRIEYEKLRTTALRHTSLSGRRGLSGRSGYRIPVSSTNPKNTIFQSGSEIGAGWLLDVANADLHVRSTHSLHFSACSPNRRRHHPLPAPLRCPHKKLTNAKPDRPVTHWDQLCYLATLPVISDRHRQQNPESSCGGRQFSGRARIE